MAFWLSNKRSIENGPQPQQQPNKPEITTETQNKTQKTITLRSCANKTTTTTTKKKSQIELLLVRN